MMRTLRAGLSWIVIALLPLAMFGCWAATAPKSPEDGPTTVQPTARLDLFGG